MSARCAFQKALSGVFLPIKSAGSECPLCFTFHVQGTRGLSLGYFFAPVGHRLNVLVIPCPLSCCIGPIINPVALWCGYTPSTIGDCFSSPVHQYFTRSFKESIVLRLGLTCIQVWFFFLTLILNRLPLCSKSAVVPL